MKFPNKFKPVKANLFICEKKYLSSDCSFIKKDSKTLLVDKCPLYQKKYTDKSLKIFICYICYVIRFNMVLLLDRIFKKFFI